MTFLNECNCIVDENLLAKAVDTYCRRNNIYCHSQYRITLHNNYASIVINRQHLFVHNLLRMVLYRYRKEYVVHHKDFNKLNNSAENLAYISTSKHTQIHAIHNWQKVRNGEMTIQRSNEYTRKDVDDDKIREMIQKGVSVQQIADTFGCHHNTIYNRMKKWKEKKNDDSGEASRKNEGSPTRIRRGHKARE